MKKILLSTIALITTIILFTSCSGGRYIGEYEELTKNTIARLDSVSTVEQYNIVVSDYSSAAEELRAKYSQENFSQSNIEKLKEITSSVSAKFFDVQAKLPLAHPEIIEEDIVE